MYGEIPHAFFMLVASLRLIGLVLNGENAPR
jgi:hypothetical protein